MRKDVKLEYFWPSDDMTKKFLLDLVNRCLPVDVNAVVTSVFVNDRLGRKIRDYIRNRLGIEFSVEDSQRRMYNIVKPAISTNTRNIWYTGENVRPPSDQEWDAFLSFEKDSNTNRNLYLPFWATRLGENLEVSSEMQMQLLVSRKVSPERKLFACAFVGNPEPHRMRAIEAISRIAKVDCYGKAFGRPVENKIDILKRYNFNICFENDLYPGYVTEKAIESWLGGAIPIWWGLDSENYLNSRALVNFAEGDFENKLEEISTISKDPDRIMLMQGEPILERAFDFKSLESKLRKLLAN